MALLARLTLRPHRLPQLVCGYSGCQQGRVTGEQAACSMSMDPLNSARAHAITTNTGVARCLVHPLWAAPITTGLPTAGMQPLFWCSRAPAHQQAVSLCAQPLEPLGMTGLAVLACGSWTQVKSRAAVEKVWPLLPHDRTTTLGGHEFVSAAARILRTPTLLTCHRTEAPLPGTRSGRNGPAVGRRLAKLGQPGQLSVPRRPTCVPSPHEIRVPASGLSPFILTAHSP